MTLLQYLSAFRVYSVDALVLALGVTVFTSLLKKTVLKKCPKKVFVFLPFVLGFLFYASYRAVLTMSAAPFTSELTESFEGGFACGCAATLYYVVYEQFLRSASAPSENTSAQEGLLPVTPLLEGVVPEQCIKAAAKALTEGRKEKSGNDLLRFVLETLRDYTVQGEEQIPDEELFLYAKTIAGFLSSLPA